MRYGIVALILAGMASAAWAEPTKQQLQQRIAALEAENAELRAKVEALQAEIVSLRQEATERDRQAAIAKEEAWQAAAERRERFVERSEADDDGRATLQTRPIKLDVTHGSRAEHYVQLIAPASGEGALKLKLNAYGSGRAYNHLESITIRVDGKPMELAITSYDRQRRGTGARKARVDRSHEFLVLRMGRPVLGQLSEANTVAGELGPTRFVGGRDLIVACRALVEAMKEAAETAEAAD